MPVSWEVAVVPPKNSIPIQSSSFHPPFIAAKPTLFRPFKEPAINAAFTATYLLQPHPPPHHLIPPSTHFTHHPTYVVYE